MTKRLVVAGLAAALLAGCAQAPAVKHARSGHLPVGVVTPDPKPSPAVTKPLAPKPRARLTAASLRPYASCAALLRSIRREGLKEMTPYGLDGVFVGSVTGGSSAALARTDGGPPVPASPGSFSGTNNQEVDVDEPDVVKTDGTVMAIVTDNGSRVRIVDVSGSRPRQLAVVSQPDWYGLQVLLVEDYLVALGSSFDPDSGRASAVATVISLADPAHPHVLRRFSTDGRLLDARLLRGRVLMVTQSTPALRFTYPVDGSPAAQTKALETNKAVLRRAKRAELLPATTVTPGGKRYRSECGSTLHPGIASGIGSTSVVSIDPSKPAPTQTLTIVSSNAVVYASSSALYLATTLWQAQDLRTGAQGAVHTDLHGFDVSHRDHISYLGTGSVTGSLLDQYSMSEHKGFLRVATTVGQPLPVTPTKGSAAALSDNRVTVLQPKDGALVRVGRVSGLGRGERIYGVRFVGDTGYVVTFRQVDPLFVIDLSDPRAPRVKGELKVTGYSAALYPLQDGQLLGVGQEVDGRLHPMGTQVSVFDVRRPTRPALLSRALLSKAYSEAQSDHHSLLWWPATRLVVLPVSGYTTARGSFAESVVYRVSVAGVLTEAGRIAAPKASTTEQARPCCAMPVSRTVVVGDLLYSVTERGVTTTPMDRLDAHTWFPFA
jgi:uncharacterized secreted protein with C-terminal beta-propeller domain